MGVNGIARVRKTESNPVCARAKSLPRCECRSMWWHWTAIDRQCVARRALLPREQSLPRPVLKAPVTDQAGLDVQGTMDSIVLDFVVESPQTPFLSPG
jgi:hypothetical protein